MKCCLEERKRIEEEEQQKEEAKRKKKEKEKASTNKYYGDLLSIVLNKISGVSLIGEERTGEKRRKIIDQSSKN